MSYDALMVTHPAIYARISSDKEGDHLGVKRQVDECRKIAQRLGYPEPKVYVDDNLSAFTGKKPRPEYLRLLEDMCDGSVDGLVVFAMDRLHRQRLEQEEFFVICRNVGLNVVHTMGGPVDLGSYMGLGMARFTGLMASMESDIKRERSLAKHAQLAADGKVSGGGQRPYGFEVDRRTIRPDEAEVVREVARRVLAGDSVRSICTDLDGRGVVSVTGGRWNPSVMSKMLRSARISGRREHNGEIVSEAEWPGIISVEDSDRLRGSLGAARRTSSAPTPRRYLLVGLLRCQRCNAVMVSRPKAGGERQYVCAKGPGLAGCGGMSVLAEPVEEIVSEGVLMALDSPELADYVKRGLGSDQEAAGLRASLDQDEAKLADLAAMFGNNEISRDEWRAARQPVDDRVEQNRKRLSRLSRTTVIDNYVGNADLLRENWSGLTLTQQNAIVGAVLDHAVIAPAVRGRNIFDPNRVTPVWRR